MQLAVAHAGRVRAGPPLSSMAQDALQPVRAPCTALQLWGSRPCIAACISGTATDDAEDRS
jgi:hypothetical protein